MKRFFEILLASTFIFGALTAASCGKKNEYTYLVDADKQPLFEQIAECIEKTDFISEPGSSSMGRYNGMALLDVDFDGTPELVEYVPGGSMGNSDFYVYDLATCERICSFECNSVDGFVVVNGENGSYFLSTYNVKAGYSERYEFVSKYVYDAENKKFESRLLYEIVRNYDESQNLIAETYYVNKDELVEVGEAEFKDFRDGMLDGGVTVENSDLRVTFWNDVIPEDKTFESNKTHYSHLMAEKLVNNGQSFE